MLKRTVAHEVSLEEFAGKKPGAQYPAYFQRIFEKDPALAAFLSAYSPEDLAANEARAFELEIGGKRANAGFTLMKRKGILGPSGQETVELAGVSKAPSSKFKKILPLIANLARDRGATNLFAFDVPQLTKSYKGAGFSPYANAPWDPEMMSEYMRQNWDYNRFAGAAIGKPEFVGPDAQWMAIPGRGSTSEASKDWWPTLAARGGEGSGFQRYLREKMEPMSRSGPVRQIIPNPEFAGLENLSPKAQWLLISKFGLTGDAPLKTSDMAKTLGTYDQMVSVQIGQQIRRMNKLAGSGATERAERLARFIAAEEAGPAARGGGEKPFWEKTRQTVDYMGGMSSRGGWNIPGLDYNRYSGGGVVTKPTMALMGEGYKTEAVFNQEQLKELGKYMGTGGGRKIEVHVHMNGVLAQNETAIYTIAKRAGEQVGRETDLRLRSG
jgi:hypothetical protein